MGRISLGAILAITIVGCGPPPVELEPPVPVMSVEHFEMIEGTDVGALNAWRQENFDKHIVSFQNASGDWIIHWVPNPGNSRQTFVTVERDKETYLWSVEELKAIEERFLNKKVVDVAWDGEWVVLLQDTLEPYEPSKD